MVVLYALLILALLFPWVVLAFRPLYLFFGLTEGERKREWPGDHAVFGAKPSGSRGISIQAPCDRVWLWITQIGQDRAGFYSYRLLENLAGAQMPDVREIRSDWSTRHVGEQLLMAPVQRYGPIAAMDIIEVEPGRHFVAANKEGTWAFVLVPIDSSVCRLIARGTWAPPKSPIAVLMHALLFDPIHFLMEWKMLRQIKRLAEAN